MQVQDTLKRTSQIVFTNRAYCRDCNLCVRVCPVKSVRMSSGQASVIDDRCIACGTCVRDCPQKAKAYRNDLDIVRNLIQTSPRVACSLAPSFAGFFPSWQRQRVPSVLRQFGFTYVAETAVGAYYVAKATAEYAKKHPKEPSIGTACPAVVEYVQKYQPKWARYLIPVVSPMIAHAAYIRKKLGSDVPVVFIGPCIAKKSEGARYLDDGRIDCVLTFEELKQWLGEEKIEVSSCEESEFDDYPKGKSRLFPLEGGCVVTGGWSGEFLDSSVVPVSGFENIDRAIRESRSGQLLEPLFCPLGCAGGPGSGKTEGSFEARADIIDYAKSAEALSPKTPETLSDEEKAFIETLYVRYDTQKSPIEKKEITENAIRQIFEQTGKASAENQLNCGACGYATCRDKAIAVIEGLAEPEMCLPYVRRLAEQRIDRIIDTSPNGIIVLDERLNILSMNPTFRSFFQCSNAICGKPISYLIDPEPFEKLLANPEQMIDTTMEYPSYNLICHIMLYTLPEEKQFVGIFVNITGAKLSSTKLDKLREQTVIQAKELMDQQIQMAESVAICLGENAARAEALLENLMNYANGEK